MSTANVAFQFSRVCSQTGRSCPRCSCVVAQDIDLTKRLDGSPDHVASNVIFVGDVSPHGHGVGTAVGGRLSNQLRASATTITRAPVFRRRAWPSPDRAPEFAPVMMTTLLSGADRPWARFSLHSQHPSTPGIPRRRCHGGTLRYLVHLFHPGLLVRISVDHHVVTKMAARRVRCLSQERGGI